VSKELIIRRAFYRVDTIDASDGVRDILLCFPSNCNDIRFILLMLGFGLYRSKSLATTKNTMFKVEHRYIPQYKNVVNARFQTN
jgi:hypothetical protein